MMTPDVMALYFGSLVVTGFIWSFFVSKIDKIVLGKGNAIH